MRFRELHIETQRQAPSNARTDGFAFLVRAGYLTRENVLTLLGEYAIKHLHDLQSKLGDSFFKTIDLAAIGNDNEVFFPIKFGSMEAAHCSTCGYTDRVEIARFRKKVFSSEEQLPLEKVLTPDCNTIESLANFLGVPKEKTAKALMFTRLSDNQFIFAVVRGDMQLSEAKLKKLAGDVRPATAEEITKSGAAAGYASPIGLKNALILVDDLIPQSGNLVAGANELGHHLKNTNYGRDYSAEIVDDLVQVKAGDACPNCGKPLSVLAVEPIREQNEFYFENILLALAESHHDDKGLTLPKSAAPFDVYLMHVPGKEMDTRLKAEEFHQSLQEAGISVLFDDRDERAGVKFNDADLIGCPVRMTVGEKNLKDEMVELKPRKEKENRLISLASLTCLTSEAGLWDLLTNEVI